MSISWEQSCSISGTDIRNVMVKMRQEFNATSAAAGRYIPIHFDPATVLANVAILALNDLIATVHFQFHLNGVLLCEYVYTIATQQLTVSGPEADNPPLEYDFSRFPPGTKPRFMVTVNPAANRADYDEMVEAFGWPPLNRLTDPNDLVENHYGTFVSGGYGVQRSLRGSRQYRI